MGKRIDMVGKKCGRLTVIRFAGINKYKYAMWLCKCECGNEVVVDGKSLRSGNTKSCGCYNIDIATDRIVSLNTKHGKTHSRLYRVWSNIKTRCYNPNHIGYKDYGGRNIGVCEEWLNDFEAFYNWSVKNGYDETVKRGGCTIDRIDNSKGYSPDNCRWVSTKVQNNNRRSNVVIEFNGEYHTITEWAEIKNMPVARLQKRLQSSNFTIEQALTLPCMRNRKKKSA